MKDIFLKYESLLQSIQLDEAKQKEFNEFVSELATALESIATEPVDVATLEAEFVAKGEEILKKARADWESVAEVAFEEKANDIKTEMAEQMSVAIESLQEELKEQVRAEFLESDEYKAFEKVKEAVAPFVEGLDAKVLEQVEKLKQEKEELSKTVEEKLLQESIDELVEGLPEKRATVVRRFLESCKTQEEVYAEFERVMKNLYEEEVDPSSEPTSEPAIDDEETGLDSDDFGGDESDESGEASLESTKEEPAPTQTPVESYFEDLVVKNINQFAINKKKKVTT